MAITAKLTANNSILPADPNNSSWLPPSLKITGLLLTGLRLRSHSHWKKKLNTRKTKGMVIINTPVLKRI